MNLDSIRSRLGDQRLLIGIALVAVAGVVAYYVSAGSPPEATEQAAQSSMPEAQPSAQNVAPEVHAQLMTLRRDVEAAPRDTAMLFELARLEYDAHQLEQSVLTFERLLEIAPDHRQAYLDLAQALVTVGRPDDARGVMERMLRMFPGDLAAMYNLGAIAANAGDVATARAQWNSVAQSGDETMARRAQESLAELDRMASAPAQTGPETQAAPGSLPPGHPPIPGGFETNVITGPPLPESAAPTTTPAR